MQHNASAYSVLTHTLNPWIELKGQNIIILEIVMLYIKLKEMEHRVPCKLFCPYTHPKPVVGLKGKKNLNVVMLHIKLRGRIEV